MMVLLEEWFCDPGRMVGPREESHGHSLLRSIKDCLWMTSVLSNLSCHHISIIMERMSQLPFLLWPLMRDPRYVAEGAM